MKCYYTLHVSGGHLVCSEHFLGQESPDGSHRCQYTGKDEQGPVKDAFATTDLFPEDLEVKCKREDDTDCEAQERPQESHDAIERWEDDRQNNNHNHDEDTHQYSTNFLERLRAVLGWHMATSKST